jgi:hypothetical protein
MKILSESAFDDKPVKPSLTSFPQNFNLKAPRVEAGLEKIYCPGVALIGLAGI